MTRRLVPLVLALVVAACAVTSTPGAPAPSAGNGSSPAAGAGSGSPDPPITASGPSGWNRGPYDLVGGTYRLAWETDGTCSALYFGIVGVRNGYRESPPSAGDVALPDMLRGSRTLVDVPAGSYFFNFSSVACRKLSATLTRAP